MTEQDSWVKEVKFGTTETEIINELNKKTPLDMTALDPITGKEFLISHSQMQAIAKNTLAMKDVQRSMKRLNYFLTFIIAILVVILIAFALIYFQTGIVGRYLQDGVCRIL